jgi:adenylate cyclase
VTSSIVSILPGRIAAATQDRVQRKPPENLAAYECVLAGKLLHHRSLRADNEEALRLLERAIALEPSYAHAPGRLAFSNNRSSMTGAPTPRLRRAL